ncbi:MAG: HD domain-containing protein [Acidisphaera sp.]|nr:HD domain-containing protein [Acidisphaera sp.]
MTADIVSDLLDLVAERGRAAYGREAVSQYEHAVQTALLAEQAGATPELITAALLHDVGHMIHDEGERPAEHDIDALHEGLGEAYLRRWFGAAVTEPVRLHVAAKRYLCAVDVRYRARLSPASEHSLRLQGGPFEAAAATAFRAGPHAEAAIALRRWDDEAKVPGLAMPDLRHFEPALRAALRTPPS